MTYYQNHRARLLAVQREYYIKHRQEILQKAFERNVLAVTLLLILIIILILLLTPPRSKAV